MNRKPTTSHDAIIIGGGPAGAMAALLLAQQGWRVAIIEKRRRYQPKTCGHCLDARAMPVLQNAGLLADVRKLAVGKAHSAMIHLPGASSLNWPMHAWNGGEGEASLVTPRGKFDQLLLDRAQQAGVDVLQPATAKVGSTAPGRCTVQALDHTLHGSLLIGADGLRSRVAQAAGMSATHRAGRKYGFSFEAPTNEPADLQRSVTHMFVIRGGYLGIVHHGRDRLHLAALVATGEGRCPNAFLDNVRDQFPLLQSLDWREKRNFVAVGPMPCRAATVARSSVVLLGDAAGYVEPFTGEGMTWALQSAQLLSSITANIAPGQWTDREATAYRQRWRQHIARRQRFCRTLAWTLERPRIMRQIMAFTRRRPHLARTVAQQVLAA